jgi:octaprenyl-diphosphate synthase
MSSNVISLKKLNSNPFDELRNQYRQELIEVDQVIKNKLFSHVGLVGEMADHLLKTGGKRLRPILTIASSKIFNYEGNRHINLAACVELIHNATLLHDDVIDHSEKRRGHQTNNAIWGNKSSILAGDYLLSRCFEMMVEDGSLEALKLLSSVSSEIAQGEILQLQHEKEIDILEKNYVEIISAKTSSLFGAAMKVGGIINDRTNKEKEALEVFGRNLGISFQITDDILDYFSKENIFGKKIGNDFIEGKITLPVILLYQHANPNQKEKLKNYFDNTDRNEQHFFEVLQWMKDYQIMSLCKKRADYFSIVASEALNIFEKNPTIKQLQDLSSYIVNRLN